MSQSKTIRYEWNQTPWKQIQVKVFKLQRRIYRASQSGNVKLVHRLQRLLTTSWYGRLLAVRRVTQDNSGKVTAGVDGVKNLTAYQRLQLTSELRQLPKPKPLRRVWIPKKEKSQKRPLGIPVMRDRAAQALIKLAMEPEWEARFEPNSFGFRPGRGCHDAIAAIFAKICNKPKYVLDADIAGCFDNISHQALLNKVKAPPRISRILNGWLKCGVMDGIFQPTESGTPQGGVASPLLANIALHGLEQHLNQLGTSKNPIQVVRYADDFCVLANNLEDINRVFLATEQWLKGIGLELQVEKTKISHTLNGKGFDFLGFNVRQYPVGKYSSKKGYKTFIKPSKKSENQHSARLRKVVTQLSTGKQEDLINYLNPIIAGWCNYYSTQVSKATFNSLYNRLFHKLVHWAKSRHPNLSGREVISRYWAVDRGGGWVFQTQDGLKLQKHTQTPIVRHVKVKGDKSPYDGDWQYWSKRRGTYPGIPRLISLLVKTQQGKCSYCGLNFMPDDLIEIHHTDGNHGNNKRENLALLHRHCHDQAHGVETLHNWYS